MDAGPISNSTSRAIPLAGPLAETAAEVCRRTVSMRLLHGHPVEDHVTVRFVRTGLLVEVLDLPGEGIDREDGGPVSFALARADALGLGLDAEDFADGVALCHDATSHATHVEASAWHCTPVLVIGVDEAGGALPIFGAEDAERWLA
jgi:hypothetical protein